MDARAGPQSQLTESQDCPPVKRRWGQQAAAAGERWVLLFDGECAFCNSAVVQIHEADTLGQFWFAPLQGDFAKPLMAAREDLASLSTVVFLVHGEASPSDQAKHVYVRSDAIVELCKRLGGWRRVASWGRIIPRPIRDGLYDFIARRRHKLLKKQACVIPSAELRSRTLP